MTIFLILFKSIKDPKRMLFKKREKSFTYINDLHLGVIFCLKNYCNATRSRCWYKYFCLILSGTIVRLWNVSIFGF